MAIFFMKCPFFENICIRERSLPRSQTTNLLFVCITATFRGYQSWPSSLPGTPNWNLNEPFFSNTSMRWLFVSATIISSSTPKQKPCGELNCPLDVPNEPNLHRICIGVAFVLPGTPIVGNPGRLNSSPRDGIEVMGDVDCGSPTKSVRRLSIPGEGPRPKRWFVDKSVWKSTFYRIQFKKKKDELMKSRTEAGTWYSKNLRKVFRQKKLKFFDK